MKNTRICMTIRQSREWLRMDPELREITEQAAEAWPDLTMEITCIYRSKAEDRAIGGSQIHSQEPHRAIDIRIRSLDEPQKQADAIAEILNEDWWYDFERPKMKVAISKPHGTGPHLHLQCHPNTVRREA